MKIYVKNFLPELEPRDDSLIKKSSFYKVIYSKEGIFRIENGIFSKLHPVDGPLQNFTHQGFNFIIDYSSYISKKDCYHIPFAHKLFNINKVEYKLNNKSKLTLVILLENKKIEDIYFYTNEKNLDLILKNEILTFLSLFNNIK